MSTQIRLIIESLSSVHVNLSLKQPSLSHIKLKIERSLPPEILEFVKSGFGLMFAGYRKSASKCNKPISKGQGTSILQYALCESKNQTCVFFLLHAISVHVPPYKPDEIVAYFHLYRKNIDIMPLLSSDDRGQLEWA